MYTRETDHGFNQFVFYFNGTPEIRIADPFAEWYVSVTEKDLEEMLKAIRETKETN